MNRQDDFDEEQEEGYEEQRNNNNNNLNQNGGEDKEEEEEEEISPDNPVIARLQARLKENLLRKLEKMTLDLREKESEMKKCEKTREAQGVELYGMQQQLAKFQLNHEKTSEKFTELSKQRIQSEKELQALKQLDAQSKNEISDQEKDIAHYQLELDRLNSKLKHIATYNEEMKHQIALKRRVAYKSEEEVLAAEKKKYEQDILVDSLNEQLRRLQDRYALYEAQLVAQKQETKSASDTLSAASVQIEALSFEINQLMQKWKSSLLNVTRRDDALKTIEDALRKQEEELLAVQGESNGFRQSMKIEEETHEKQTMMFNKIKSEMEYYEKLKTKIKENRQKLANEFLMLKNSTDYIDQDLSKVTAEKNRITEETNAIQKNIQACQEEIQKIEQEIDSHVNSQITLSKSKHNTEVGANKLRALINEKVVEIGNLDNELARIRVDALNTGSHNLQLKNHLDELVQVLKEKDKLIEKCEVEIRRRNDQIEKKQAEVDKLNKKYDQFTQSFAEENLGPLEAIVHNLTKNIKSLQQSNTETQNDWLRRQHELVGLQATIQKTNQDISELESKYAILHQKHMRLAGRCVNENNEITAIDASMRSLNNEMQKLNSLISKNIAEQTELAESNLNFEMEIVTRLREHEIESTKLQSQIEVTKEEKAKIIEDLIEAERQIMLWEKKIQLEKEMQEALNPEVGAMEQKNMKKEIHRMKLRYDDLLKHQENIVREMEKLLEKRETIFFRQRSNRDAMMTISQKQASAMSSSSLNNTNTNNGLSSSSSSSSATNSQIQNELESLQRKIKTLMEQIRGADEEITSKTGIVREMNKNLDELVDSTSNIRSIDGEEQESIENYQIQRTKFILDLSRLQRLIKKYETMEQGKYLPSIQSEELQSVTNKLNEKSQAYLNSIEQLSKDFPHLSKDLNGLKYIIAETKIL